LDTLTVTHHQYSEENSTVVLQSLENRNSRQLSTSVTPELFKFSTNPKFEYKPFKGQNILL